jgi:hypothetical protein
MVDAVIDIPVDRRCNGNISLVTTGQDIKSWKELNHEPRTPSQRSPRVREYGVVGEHDDCKTVQHVLQVITMHLPMTMWAATTCAGQFLPYTVTIELTIARQIKHPVAPDINTGRLPTLSTRTIAGKVASILGQIRKPTHDFVYTGTRLNDPINPSGNQGGGVSVKAELAENWGWEWALNLTVKIVRETYAWAKDRRES